MNHGGKHVHVVLQLHLAVVIVPGLLNLVNLLLQVLAQVQHAGHGPEAFLLAGAVQQILRQGLGRLDLLDGQALRVPAFNDIVIHLEVDILLEILVELRRGGHVVEEVFILAVVNQDQDQHDRRNGRHEAAKDHHQAAHPALDGVRAAHGRFPPPR